MSLSRLIKTADIRKWEFWFNDVIGNEEKIRTDNHEI